jgi:hypothetical protein
MAHAARTRRITVCSTCFFMSLLAVLRNRSHDCLQKFEISSLDLWMFANPCSLWWIIALFGRLVVSRYICIGGSVAVACRYGSLASCLWCQISQLYTRVLNKAFFPDADYSPLHGLP